MYDTEKFKFKFSFFISFFYRNFGIYVLEIDNLLFILYIKIHIFYKINLCKEVRDCQLKPN